LSPTFWKIPEAAPHAATLKARIRRLRIASDLADEGRLERRSAVAIGPSSWGSMMRVV
jgi:hypothetical protein